MAVWEKDYQGWSDAADKALTINPNYAQALNSKATLFIYRGEPHKGIPFIEKALRLDPAFTQYIHFLGTAYFVAEDYEKASIEFRKRIERDPRTDLSRAFLSSALGHLGKINDARKGIVFSKILDRMTGHRSFMGWGIVFSKKLHKTTEL